MLNLVFETWTTKLLVFYEIIACIGSLNANKAVGYDNIPAYFLKVAVPIIASHLCFLIDYAFLNGIFPDNCKIAKVIPIHKKGKKDNPSNFRPISILTCISKVIEKMIYKRVFSFLSKNNVLAPQQYGFQKNISTIYAILELLTATYDNINANNCTGILFFDLTKAFDTVCHQILFAKLQHYGIRGPSLQLIKSFLERKQFVSINGVNSDLQHNSFGVPQGSTLDPFLFWFIKTTYLMLSWVLQHFLPTTPALC